MSFVDIAKTAPSRPLCSIGRVIYGLPDAEAEALTGMLAADVKIWPHIGEGSVQEAFQKEGYEIGDKPIRAHRARTCVCYRANP